MKRPTLSTVLAAIAAICLVSGCASEPESPFGPGQSFTWDANQWAVSDRRDLNELQIVATTALSSGLGSAGIYKYPVSDLPRPVYAEAVKGWFLTGGRHCTIDDASQAGPKTYVFHYSCWVPTYTGA
jgi:hypothetical protein